MKCLILGGTGMLGHKLWTYLSREHETWVTIRGTSDTFPDHPDFKREFVCENINALNLGDVVNVLGKIHPDVVINCVGLIKQHPDANDPILAIETNALLPHRLAALCKAAGARLIHISTDCVFSGEKGSYTEDDYSDARDLYGRTKYLGETHYPHTVTLRTSIIGPELHSRYGLLEWFLSQKQAVKGFTRAIYSGFTTDELASIIANFVLPNPDLQGLYHVSSESISKYELLQLFNEYFEHGILIEPDDSIECDRSLQSEHFKEMTNYQPPKWSEMIASMTKNYTSLGLTQNSSNDDKL